MAGKSTSGSKRRAPVVKITQQTLAHDTGASASDLITNDGTVQLAGTLTGVANTIVQVFDGTTYLGTATVSKSGTWTFATVLPPGTHALHAVAVDPFGSTATTAAMPAITVDKSVPTVAFQYESQTVGSNVVDIWGTVSGSPGTTVEIYSGGTDLGAATITGNNWHFATANLPAGNYSFDAVATTVAGNTAKFSGQPPVTVGTVTGTLDWSRYTTQWKQDFTTSSQIDRNIFPIVYGNPDQFSFGADGLTLTSTRAEGFANVGILQANWEKSLSQGYGLYSVTASHPAGQGTGIAILLWPANNQWPGPELDMLEDWDDPTSQSAHMTVHYKGPNGENMANSIKFSVDLTKMNTFSMDWEAGSLKYYVNGNEMFEITGSEVPLDAAHGGINAAFGAQITDIGTNYEPSDLVSLTIANMSYSSLNPQATTLGSVQALRPAAPAVNTSPAVQSLLNVMSMNQPISAFQTPAAPSLTDQLLGSSVAASPLGATTNSLGF